LNDAQAVGAAFALRAVSQLDRGGDTSAGIADSEIAVKLSPSSPSVRSVRGALLLATGGLEAGTHELDAALQLRSDASRRNNLATLGLMSSNPDAAAKEVATALAEAPDYALARVTLATVHLMRGEPDLARVELEKAERLEPDLAVLPQIWAQFYASTNEPDRALAKAQEAVRRRPKDTQARLVLARIDRASGRYDDMRLQAREIMARVPGDQQPRMRELLRGLLGPTAFEDAEPDAADPDKAQAAQAASDALSATSPGHDDNNARGPQLQPGSDSKSLQLQPGGGSRFQLGGGGDTKLKLKLNE
jgi:tetratricopeptide (TPR) repeat protein